MIGSLEMCGRNAEFYCRNLQKVMEFVQRCRAGQAKNVELWTEHSILTVTAKGDKFRPNNLKIFAPTQSIFCRTLRKYLSNQVNCQR